MSAVFSRPRRWFDDDRGAQLVEFALVFPVLMFLTGGILDVGLMIKDYQVVTNAAREGARWAATRGLDQELVQERVDAYLDAGGLDDTATTLVEPVQVDSGDGSFAAVSVVVSYPHDFLILKPLSELLAPSGVPATVTLRASTVMRQELPQ